MNYEELWKELHSKVKGLEKTHRKLQYNEHDGILNFGMAEAFGFINILMNHIEKEHGSNG